jgi:hypothetical protein
MMHKMPNSSAAARGVAWTLTALFSISLLPRVARSADELPFDAPKLYEKYCAACHDHPQGRIPARSVIAQRSSDEVLQALATGLMRAQAAGLNLNERTALAAFLTGKTPTGELVVPPETNMCAKRDPPLDMRAAQWNGWGRDLENSRFQPNRRTRVRDQRDWESVFAGCPHRLHILDFRCAGTRATGGLRRSSPRHESR